MNICPATSSLRLSSSTRLLILSLLALSTTILSNRSEAGDWPQILGPNRNGQANGEKIAAWPASGPRTLWTYTIGEGFSGPSVVGNSVIVFHRVDNKEGTEFERIEAVNAQTGKQVWKTDFDATYAGGINPDTGPRSVPVIAGDAIVAYGAAGDLHCLALKDGKKRWSRETWSDFNAPQGYFGAGTTPIVVGKHVIVNVGGRQGSIVAFNLADGKMVWSAVQDTASYSSPSLTKVGGKTVVIFLTRLKCVALDPVDGKVQFEFPFGQRGPTVNAATPLVFKDKFFITASYGIGGKLIEVGKEKLSTVWENDTSLSSQYNTPIHHEGFLYGSHGREDGGSTSLRCIDATNGDVKWSIDQSTVANVIKADELLITLTADGNLSLVKLDSKKHVELAKYSVAAGVTRALPALSNGKLFIRINGNGKNELKCFDLSPKK